MGLPTQAMTGWAGHAPNREPLLLRVALVQPGLSEQPHAGAGYDGALNGVVSFAQGWSGDSDGWSIRIA